MNILFAGGGTGGSATPLLAIYEHLKKYGDQHQFFWLGTKNGPEKRLVAGEEIKFKAIFWGKWRRYFSWRNLADPIFIGLGFLQSLYYIAKWNPEIIMTAGSFVAVPVVWAGWILRKKILVHQQDLRKGLANSLIAPLADRVTVAFEESLRDFPARKVVWTGNPARSEILAGDKKEGMRIFNLEKDLAALLVLGGGTGALAVNQLFTRELIQELTEFCQIIHITGAGKTMVESNNRYHAYPFLTSELKHAYAAADLAVSRAGLGALTELSSLGKPVILIPLPNSHQEDNARYFAEKEAAVVLEQGGLTSGQLGQKIKELLADVDQREKLGGKMGRVVKVERAPRCGSLGTESSSGQDPHLDAEHSMPRRGRDLGTRSGPAASERIIEEIKKLAGMC